jgi:hypothetical protein
MSVCWLCQDYQANNPSLGCREAKEQVISCAVQAEVGGLLEFAEKRELDNLQHSLAAISSNT